MTPIPEQRVRGPLRAILCAIAATAVIAPTLVVTHAPATPVRPRAHVKAPPQRVVPKAEVPPVEPVAFVDLAPDEARAYNAGIPFSTAPNPAARPFRFAGSAEDRARALDCLATAVIYEAGDDSVGERAVAQVILNRLRHPAFPKTVCGVVFEGQERTTGCQFTFTCDGALNRWHPSDIAWRRARQVAELALNGAVYRPVGHATHYHTDWVVPYWQSSLDKVAGVGSHLFFRWSGWWGTPPAFNRRWTGGEPVIAKLADRSDAHRMGEALVAADAAMVEAGVATDGAVPAAIAPIPGEPNSFLLTLPKGVTSDALPALAQRTCGDRKACKVMAWSDAAATPRTLPLNMAQVAAMAFSYLRDPDSGIERQLWNCAVFPRWKPSDCMKRQTLRAEPVASPTPSPVAELDGVRRRSVTAAPAEPPRQP